jgi:hypothetical protein
MKDSTEQATSTNRSLYSSSPISGKSAQDASADKAFSLPKMGAEVGYQVVSDDDVPPFRASGLVCFVLGILSFWATIAWQMLIIPFAAIIFGIVAMRKWQGQRPAGTTVAVIGLLLASFFGATGLTVPLAKRNTMGKQAEYFAREFLELAGRGDVELVAELRKEARNRQVKGMNIKEAYEKDQIARASLEEGSSSDSVVNEIRLAGPNIQWELAEPVRVYMYYGMERADTYWIDPSGTIKEKVQVELQWTPDDANNVGHWHVNLFQYWRELLVAPSVL